MQKERPPETGRPLNLLVSLLGGLFSLFCGLLCNLCGFLNILLGGLDLPLDLGLGLPLGLQLGVQTAVHPAIIIDLLCQLFSSQLITKGERHLLDTNRTYYKLLRQITIEGQQQGLFRDDLSINDITRAYAMYERGMMYDWCLSNGSYSLLQYSQQVLPLFLRSLCK